MSLLNRLMNNDFTWVFRIVYGPSNQREKLIFWEDLSQAGNSWHAPWLLIENFNSSQLQDKRLGFGFSLRESYDFNNFLNDQNLLEFDEGLKFSFTNNKNPPLLSKLNYFLGNSGWFEVFLGFKERYLGYKKSDHHGLLLQGSQHDSGNPKSFQFQPH